MKDGLSSTTCGIWINLPEVVLPRSRLRLVAELLIGGVECPFSDETVDTYITGRQMPYSP